MNTVAGHRYIQTPDNAIQREAHFLAARPSRWKAMDLRCPSCNSSDLKSVSLAHEEGLFHTTARSRLRGFLLGENGPNLVVGRAITQGTHQSQLSMRLRPAAKWSYAKLILWSALFSFGLLVVYIHSVMASATPASSLGVVTYLVLFPVVFLFCLVLVWRHNTFFYPRQLELWNRSFLCNRCGAVSEHNLVD
jgi:hypothetical protein